MKNPFSWAHDVLESYHQGENWAEQVIEKAGQGTDSTLPFEVDQEFAEGLAGEYGKDPSAFYDGFRQRWNEHVEDVTPRQDSVLRNVSRWFST